MALINSPFKTYFSTELQNALYETNEFTRLWNNVSQYLNNRTISIPQWNTTAGVMKNFTNTGGVNYAFGDQGDTRVAQDSLTFNVDDYETKELLVTDFEASLLAYDSKNASVTNTVNYLAQFLGKSLLYSAGKNVPSTKVIKTTGAATSLGPDGTTARKSLTYKDVVQLGLMMDLDKLPGERYLVLPSQMYTDILLTDEFKKANELGNGTSVVADGVVAKINGINIMKKPTVIQMSGITSATTITGALSIDPFISEAAFTTHVGLAFISDAVAYAEGAVKVWQLEVPAKYGTVITSSVSAAANESRKDHVGIYLVAQGS